MCRLLAFSRSPTSSPNFANSPRASPGRPTPRATRTPRPPGHSPPCPPLRPPKPRARTSPPSFATSARRLARLARLCHDSLPIAQPAASASAQHSASTSALGFNLSLSSALPCCAHHLQPTEQPRAGHLPCRAARCHRFARPLRRSTYSTTTVCATSTEPSEAGHMMCFRARCTCAHHQAADRAELGT